jgi:hypothetical protein
VIYLLTTHVGTEQEEVREITGPDLVALVDDFVYGDDKHGGDAIQIRRAGYMETKPRRKFKLIQGGK